MDINKTEKLLEATSILVKLLSLDVTVVASYMLWEFYQMSTVRHEYDPVTFTNIQNNFELAASIALVFVYCLY
jgi:hypothetical protein